MSRRQFTEDQQQQLRKNPYVYSVTATRFSLTREFKKLFMEACRAGGTPGKILEDHGFSVELIGERRFFSIPQHIREEFKKHGEFREGYSSRSNGEDALEGHPSGDDELKQLRHEVDYLKQEMEFLKKFPQSGIQEGRCTADE